MSSRLSLGGSESRSVLRDTSSRYNSTLSSMPRGEETPQKVRRGLLDSYEFRGGLLGDTSSRSRSASAPRRQSLGGDALRSETPQKDRRAMLEKWRRDRAAGGRGHDIDTKKRTRGTETPPLPPGSYSNTPSTSSAADINAYQSRKFQKVQQESDDTLSQISNFNQTIHYFDDESASDMGRSAGTRRTGRTPRKGRGLGGPARRKSVMPGTILQAPQGTYKKESVR